MRLHSIVLLVACRAWVLLLLATATLVSTFSGDGTTPLFKKCRHPYRHPRQIRLVLTSLVLDDSGGSIEVCAKDVLDASTIQQIDACVQQRAAARWRGDYEASDRLRDELLLWWQQQADNFLPTGLSLHIEDLPRSVGGGSRWTVQCQISKAITALVPAGEPTVLQMAHSALGLSVSSSQTRMDGSQQQRQSLVTQALVRLQAWGRFQHMMEDRHDGQSILRLCQEVPSEASYWWAVEKELRGRKAADAAFWLAIAGVTETKLYDLLLQVGLKEVQRFVRRPTCRNEDIFAIVDRFAAAGMLPTGSALRLLSSILSAKEKDSIVPVDEIASRWDLHSDSCALLVWKFSTRQRKQRDFLTSAARHWQTQNIIKGKDTLLTRPSYDWNEMYGDPSRPLVIDLGCGMGLSLLGGAATATNGEAWHCWQNCNFFGVDLNSLAIGYAKGISNRWNLEDSLQFVVDAAEHALQAIQSSYPGPIAQILIQFPTPFRLLPTNSVDPIYQGNTQLPKDAEHGFMVTKNLLKLTGTLLEGTSSTLLLQSNCEDVALYMYETAIEQGNFVGTKSEDPRTKMPLQSTQRTDTWLAAQSGETVRRAMGPEWWNSAVLPAKCQTETEIVCGLNGTPVHRSLLVSAVTPKSIPGAPVA